MSPKWMAGVALGAGLALAGCTETAAPPVLKALKVADGVDSHGAAKPGSGETVSVEALRDGQTAFTQYCYGCHGPNGDGHGPASATMRPPPRNFGLGLFKFAGTVAGGVPTDEALDRTLRRGLQGTPMLAWDIPEIERKSIIAYIKTFKCVPKGKSASEISSRFETEAAGAPLEISPDPWKGKEAEAVERGKVVYHVSGTDKAGKTYAGCASCHAAYVTREEMSNLNKQVTGEGLTEFRDDLYRTSLRESEYPLDLDENCEAVKKYQVLPPDFLFHRTKTIWPVGTQVDCQPDLKNEQHCHPYTAEDQRTDLYRAIAAGIGGAAMPQWKGALPEEHLWALAYYVQTLINLRGTTGALTMREKLAAQPEVVPAPPVEKPAEGIPVEKKGPPDQKTGIKPPAK